MIAFLTVCIATLRLCFLKQEQVPPWLNKVNDRKFGVMAQNEYCSVAAATPKVPALLFY